MSCLDKMSSSENESETEMNEMEEKEEKPEQDEEAEAEEEMQTLTANNTSKVEFKIKEKNISHLLLHSNFHYCLS